MDYFFNFCKFSFCKPGIIGQYCPVISQPKFKDFSGIISYMNMRRLTAIVTYKIKPEAKFKKMVGIMSL
jgi:hypothetical protein